MSKRDVGTTRMINETNYVMERLDMILLFVLCCLCNPTSSDIPERYVVDALVVLDRPAYNRWLQREPATMSNTQKELAANVKVKEYISLVVRQANSKLETLAEGNNWSVQLSVEDFVIGVNPLGGVASIANGAVALQSALSTLTFWVNFNKYTQFDYVILLTGYDLKPATALPYEVKGIANIGTVCKQDGTNIAIVEDRGAFQSAHFVAHEFGHGLGAKHDGETPNEACPDANRYLMAITNSDVTTSNRINPWILSSCSKQSIRNHIENITLIQFPECLQRAKTPASEFTATKGVLAGQVYGATQQCKHFHGDRSHMCWGDNFGQPSDMCTSLYCLDTRQGVLFGSQCVEHTAADGTSCADRKVCSKGQCISTPQAPALKECPFGDSNALFENGYTCSQYTRLRPTVCYLPHVKSACCTSCAAIATSSEACPYGNKRTGCTTDLCPLINVDGTRYEELCCKTCGYDVTTPCADVENVDGLTCAERVKLNGIQGCYNPALAYKCCSTCASLRTNVLGCEYGDLVVDGSCPEMNQPNCARFGSQCCHSCNSTNTNNRHNNPNGASSLLANVIMQCYTSLLVYSVIFIFLWRKGMH